MGLKSFISKRMPKKRASTQISNPTYKLVTSENPSSVISECYRRVKVALSFANVDKHVKVLGITSAVQGEGKTLTLLNIAATYVEDGSKVVVVDLDLRRPKLHKHLRIENKNGIADVCNGSISLKDAIKTSKYGFDAINAGSKVSFPTAVLGSKRMEEVIAELATMYDVVLVDCSPIVPVTDAIIISRFCDGVVYIVSQKVKEKEASIEGVNILKNNNVNLLGCILTEADRGNKGYYSSKYKYYHYESSIEDDADDAAEAPAEASENEE